MGKKNSRKKDQTGVVGVRGGFGKRPDFFRFFLLRNPSLSDMQVRQMSVDKFGQKILVEYCWGKHFCEQFVENVWWAIFSAQVLVENFEGNAIFNIFWASAFKKNIAYIACLKYFVFVCICVFVMVFIFVLVIVMISFQKIYSFQSLKWCHYCKIHVKWAWWPDKSFPLDRIWDGGVGRTVSLSRPWTTDAGDASASENQNWEMFHVKTLMLTTPIINITFFGSVSKLEFRRRIMKSSSFKEVDTEQRTSHITFVYILLSLFKMIEFPTKKAYTFIRSLYESDWLSPTHCWKTSP